MGSDNTVTRSVMIPVAGPVGDDWQALRDLVVAAMRKATRLMNLSTSWLFAHDPGVGHERLKDYRLLMPDGTPLATQIYRQGRLWTGDDGDSSATSCICRHAFGLYSKFRYEAVRPNASRSVPSFTFPQPYPLRAEMMRNLRRGAGGQMLVDVKLVGTWITLRLRGGRDFHRQWATLDKVIAGEVECGEGAIMTVPANPGDHRSGLTMNTYRRNEPHARRVVFKLAVRLPVRARAQREGALIVSTGPTAFLRAARSGRQTPEWWVNGDEAFRTLVAYQNRRLRLDQDNKSERRSGSAGSLSPVYERLSRKHNDWMDTWRHRISLQVARHAERSRVALVVYDDTDRSFLPRFNYSDFWTKLGNKLADRGIGLVTLAQHKAQRKAAGEREAFEREMMELDALVSALRGPAGAREADAPAPDGAV